MTEMIYAIHLTDQRLYNKFDLCLKAQLKVDTRKETSNNWNKLIRDIFYIADFVATKMKVNRET